MTSPNNATPPADPLVAVPAPFVDARGVIQTLVDGAIQTVQIIVSAKGTVRANHYHRADSHYMYVTSGSMQYYYRPVGATDAPRSVLVRAGEMVFTPPMVEHAVFFPEDCMFINIAARSREQATYESDVVRVKLLPVESAP
jgi:mannose-6-phosphate isomerase-like protein (cupin superfamily)